MMIVYGIMFVILVAGFVFASRKAPEERLFYRLKFVWAALIVLAGYMFLTVPYVGYFYRFVESPKVPDTIQSNDEARKHLLDHSQRIDRLEQELGESREQMREIRDHYQRILQLLMTAIFAFGFTQILKKNPQNEPDPNGVLNLKE